MIRSLFCLLALSALTPALAAPNTLTQSVGTDLVLPLGSLPERVCWYQDQKYFQGARIQQGDVWLECGPQHVLESKGPLAWHEPQLRRPAAEESGNRETIRVGQ
ncbi:DUF1496 domain-containing protein [Aeromonas sp. MR16]|uniref:DUF1496 domain-containing protein n=1 Tax=Aeromonas sp. MR16 TaxID=2923420 RepID=UPI001F4A818A|nr:DUF1496 domain-containing protein [Aeromonas sp. MR16]MCH7372879.1 YnjH family protein [Aeromonas sp. MR16]